MLLEASESQLVLVDYQSRLMPVIFENALVLSNAVRLGHLARLMEVPTWGTEQNPTKLGENAIEVKALCAKTLSKMRFSAAQEGLLSWLRPGAGPVAGNTRSLPRQHRESAARSTARNTIVVAGCEAHVCLLQTALDLLDEEFDVWVVTDACGSRTERNRDAAFDRLAAVGVELVTTEMVAFEWLRTAQHPGFKAVQMLIR